MRKIRQYPTPPEGKLGLSLDEVSGLTSLGLASIRGAIAAGKLKARRYGRRIVIQRDDVEEFLRKLPSSR